MKLTIARLLPVRGIQRSGGLSYSHGVVTGVGVGRVSESVSTAQGAELPAERVLKKKKEKILSQTFFSHCCYFTPERQAE